MKIEILDETLYIKYENFIQKFEGGLFYYSIKYKNFLEKLLGCSSRYFIVLEENSILAVYPMMLKNGKFGKVYNSLPFYGSHGGILSISEDATRLIINELNRLSKLDDTASNMYISNIFENNIYKNFNSNIVDKRRGQLTFIDLDNNIENRLMKKFHSKTRNMIRKAEKSDIEVIIDNSAFEFLEDMHKKNMESIGGQAKSSAFFELISYYFKGGEDFDIYIAKKDNEYIAGMLIFYYNNVIEYFTPVIKAEYRTYQPLSLLIYQAMIAGAKRGFKWWNWGGTWFEQEGVYRFKNRFGAIDKEYQYYININNNDILKSNVEELLSEYKNFYVIPFNRLELNEE